MEILHLVKVLSRGGIYADGISVPVEHASLSLFHFEQRRVGDVKDEGESDEGSFGGFMELE